MTGVVRSCSTSDSDNFNARCPRARLNFDTRTETDLGTLRGFMPHRHRHRLRRRRTATSTVRSRRSRSSSSSVGPADADRRSRLLDLGRLAARTSLGDANVVRERASATRRPAWPSPSSSARSRGGIADLRSDIVRDQRRRLREHLWRRTVQPGGRQRPRRSWSPARLVPSRSRSRPTQTSNNQPLVFSVLPPRDVPALPGILGREPRLASRAFTQRRDAARSTTCPSSRPRPTSRLGPVSASRPAWPFRPLSRPESAPSTAATGVAASSVSSTMTGFGVAISGRGRGRLPSRWRRVPPTPTASRRLRRRTVR